MFQAEVPVSKLSIKPEHGKGTIAVFSAINTKQAGIQARAMLKALGINKEVAQLSKVSKLNPYTLNK